MASVTQGPAAEGFIASEANGSRSREAVTVDAEQTLVPGAALVLNATGKYEAFDAAVTASGVAIACRGVTTGAGESAQVAAILRDAEVVQADVVFPDGTLQADIDAFFSDLADNGVIAR